MLRKRSGRTVGRSLYRDTPQCNPTKRFYKMFIDIHVHPHFFEPICDDDKLETRRQNLDIYRNSKASLSHIENQMRCAGLDRLCILGQDERSLTGQIVVGNDEIASLVRLRPDLFIGFASVDPLVESATEDLEYAFSQLKLSGLKLNPSKQHYYPSDVRLKPIYELCLQYNKPITFHSGLSWEKEHWQSIHDLSSLRRLRMDIRIFVLAWPISAGPGFGKPPC